VCRRAGVAGQDAADAASKQQGRLAGWLNGGGRDTNLAGAARPRNQGWDNGSS
jgi:hypothetical protein